MPHDRNEICVMKIECLEEKVSSLDTQMNVFKGSNERMNQAMIDLLPRVDRGHQEVDTLKLTIASIDKSLTTLIAVTEEKRLDRERLRKQVDTLSFNIETMNALVLQNNEYIKQQKESKVGLVYPIIIGCFSVVAGWIAGHIK